MRRWTTRWRCGAGIRIPLKLEGGESRKAARVQHPSLTTVTCAQVLLRQYRDKIVALREEADAKDVQIKVETQKIADLTTRLAEAEVRAPSNPPNC